jgi:ectoine hydroxylase-related dioxygenase (phytanoyl-CoA dioxygenase family)
MEPLSGWNYNEITATREAESAKTRCTLMNRVNVDPWVNEEKAIFYKENGFVQIDNVLSPEELEELRVYIEEAMSLEDGLATRTDKKDGSYYRVLNQKVNTWRDHGGMAKYIFNARFAQIAAKLSGMKKARLFHDHALWKMPGDSKPTPWHQDFPYWPMNETGAMSMWLALDDVDEKNGCMMFVPKSQTLGKLTGIDFLNPTDIFELAKGTDVEQQKPVIVRMKAGSCTFHDGLTFHYAHANQTEKPRRALAVIYMPDGTTYNGKSHLLTDGQSLETDQPLAGPLFPVLAIG